MNADDVTDNADDVADNADDVADAGQSRQPGASEQARHASTGSSPLDELLERLRGSLGELTPEPLLESMQPVMESFLAQFQLVPHREFQAHMANLERLERTVAALEARLADLENRG